MARAMLLRVLEIPVLGDVIRVIFKLLIWQSKLDVISFVSVIAVVHFAREMYRGTQAITPIEIPDPWQNGRHKVCRHTVYGPQPARERERERVRHTVYGLQ